MSGPFPRRIICLTEESVETLYRIGAQDLIVGVSAYVKRPAEAKNHPVVCTFKDMKIERILDLSPDLVLGHSDVQKNIARDLVSAGINTFIANHHSIQGILDYIEMLGRIVDRPVETKLFLEEIQEGLAEATNLVGNTRPKVYFEEWDDPMICASRWISELISHCGGTDVFSEQAKSFHSTGRVVSMDMLKANTPDIYLGCWCGKKVDLKSVEARFTASQIPIKDVLFQEVRPEIFLQPGPAPLIEGVKVLTKIFENWP